MQASELIQGIVAKFKDNRIVFWHDPDQSFIEELDSLSEPLTAAISANADNVDSDEGFSTEVTVLNMADESVLATKKRIEIDEPKNRFLLYFPEVESEPERDWLLDIRLYSEQFFADHSSMLLNELGITNMALRSYIQKRQKFFANKQRLAGLKKRVAVNDDALTLDRKMIAVVVKSDSSHLSDILFSLLKEYASYLENDANGLPLWDQLIKFDLVDALWVELDNNYGYVTQQPSFSDFVLKLFCTDFWAQTEGIERDWLLANNVLKSNAGRATALALMVTWRDSRTYCSHYEIIGLELSQQLDISAKSSQYRPVELVRCETFETVEQNIIRGLVETLLDSSIALDRVEFDSIISTRLASHWSLSNPAYTSFYQALRSAEMLIYLRNTYVDGFHFDSAKSMYDAYVNEIYKFDQAYRLFNEHVLISISLGSDMLRQLDEEIESIYTNWYLYELGLAWDYHLGDEQLLDKWQLADIPNQYHFYDNEVQARFNTTQLQRAFVIISDAMRYEVASELGSIINNEKRFKAAISTQLGVLPSYTQLGMAALLPHDSLSYQPKKSNAVYVDGVSSAGLDNRDKILNKVDGMAVSAKELMSWSNQEGRDKIRAARVVYIYHDTIDAIGDSASTEEKTFEACRSAIDELKNLVGRIINRLNGSHVVVTADHGFLFQQKDLVADNKTKLTTKPSGVMEAKKRYVIGDNLPSDDAYWKGYISNTANGLADSSCQNQTEFLIPKASQRFHFVSGAKFVHGGAMLQEICVPIIHIRELDKEQATKLENQPVGVVVANQPIKLVSNIDKIKFIQTDAVGEQFVSRQINVFIVDSNGKEVSSRETINFDSSSKIMDERTREARLSLIGSQFDRNAQYTLILEDAKTQVNYSQYSVTIDLAHLDDFF